MNWGNVHIIILSTTSTHFLLDIKVGTYLLQYKFFPFLQTFKKREINYLLQFLTRIKRRNKECEGGKSKVVNFINKIKKKEDIKGKKAKMLFVKGVIYKYYSES